MSETVDLAERIRQSKAFKAHGFSARRCPETNDLIFIYIKDAKPLKGLMYELRF